MYNNNLHIKDRSTIGTQSVNPMELLAIVAALQKAANININIIVMEISQTLKDAVR